MNFSYSNCKISVVGMDMDCPLCGVTVTSGHEHSCARPDTPLKAKRVRKTRDDLVCEGCGKVAGKSLPAGWVQYGSSKIRNKLARIKLAAWCPNCFVPNKSTTGNYVAQASSDKQPQRKR